MRNLTVLIVSIAFAGAALAAFGTSRPGEGEAAALIDSADDATGGLNASQRIRRDLADVAWVEALRPHSLTIARTINVANAGLIASLAATRSSDNTCAGGCMGTIGYESIVLNDNVRPDQTQSAYGGYFEATRATGAGTTHGLEIDVANQGSTVALAPVDMFRPGTTPGLWLASGAGRSTSVDSSAAIGIIANGAKWQKGIVFGRDGLALRSDRRYEAISLDTRQAISFYGRNAGVVANIYSTAGTGSPMDMEFSDAGMSVGSQGKPLLSLDRQGIVKAATGLKLSAVAFADLPACNGQAAGIMVFVRDAKNPITRWHQQIVAGGGHTQAFLSCSGSGWYAFSF